SHAWNSARSRAVATLSIYGVQAFAAAPTRPACYPGLNQADVQSLPPTKAASAVVSCGSGAVAGNGVLTVRTGHAAWRTICLFDLEVLGSHANGHQKRRQRLFWFNGTGDLQDHGGIVGNQLASSNDPADAGAEFGVALNVPAEDVADTDMDHLQVGGEPLG